MAVQLFIFNIEFLPDHPQYGLLQACLAHIFISGNPEDGRQIAEGYLSMQRFRVLSLRDAYLIPHERIQLLGTRAKAELAQFGIYVEIVTAAEGPDVGFSFSV